MCTRNSRTLEAGQEDCEFKVSLTYIIRPCQEEERKHIIKTRQCQAWWCVSIIPALGKQRQTDQGFKAILSSIVSLKPAWAV